jgi:hypothetical protein
MGRSSCTVGCLLLCSNAPQRAILANEPYRLEQIGDRGSQAFDLGCRNRALQARNSHVTPCGFATKKLDDLARRGERRHPGRRGVAILWVLFVLALLSGVIAAITWQHLAGRTALDEHHKNLQASWLARGGMELAAARLLESPQSYKGDVTDLIPNSKVHVELQANSGSNTSFVLKSEATYPVGDPHPAIRTLTRKVRRVSEKGQIRLEPELSDTK